MKKIIAVLLLLTLLSCQETTMSNQEKWKAYFEKDIEVLLTDVSKLESLVKLNRNCVSLQTQFQKAHSSYKKVEMISEYYFPSVSKAVNGPALSEYEENDGKTIPPEGFQVIEEYLFPSYDSHSKEELLKEIGILTANLKRLEKVAQTNQITSSNVFDAMRLEVYRVITLGITGFDSPVALNSINEIEPVLSTIQKYVQVYNQEQSFQQYEGVIQVIEQGKMYLSANKNFNTFDRAFFIKNIANVLSKRLYDLQAGLKVPFVKETRGLKTTAKTLFDSSVFDADAFSAFPDYITTPEKVSLGKMLFYDPVLSGNNSRSCVSCHIPEKAFTDGLEKATSLDGKSLVERNTPTLNNIAFQRAFFYDSKVSYLEDQAVAVITNKVEMHGSLETAAKVLKTKSNYVNQFSKSFPGKNIDAFAIKNALASYIRSLSNYNAKFDKYMRDETQFSTDEKAGFNLFAGKAKCATCHFIPLTNGTVPPNFIKSESEVLGVPNRNNYLDDDLGKYNVTKADIHKNAFKTPTIRNSEITAPYMHNGVFKTLEEVIDFYNKGGGKGLGFKLDNQTLPEDELKLSEVEKKQLISFIKTLTDTENQ